jgi:hypothetical protein
MKILAGIVFALFLIVVTFLSAEGVYSLYQWTNPKPSISRQLAVNLPWFFFDNAALKVPVPAPEAPSVLTDGDSIPNAADFPNATMMGQIDPEHYLQSWDHLNAWIKILAEDGYIFGGDLNGDTLRDSTKALEQAGGSAFDYKLFSKSGARIGLMPNVRLSQTSVRGFYSVNIWTQPAVVGPFPGTKGNPAAKYFFDHYTLPLAYASTTADGFRTTLPEVKSDKVIIVMGDSVAYGALVGDEQTLPSFLQKHYPSIRVVNAGIPGSQADENYERLGKLLEQFKGRVEGVVYLHFENDFFSLVRPGVVLEPINMVAPVKGLLDKYGIKHRVYVVHASLYVTAPDVARLGKASEHNEKIVRHEAVVALAKKAGFITLDSRQIVRDFANRNQSVWSSMALYTDHSHFSVLGNQYFADAIAATDWLNKE